MALDQAILAFVVASIVVLITVTPLATLKLEPYYHPKNYTLTSCQVTFSSQNSYRCCQYDTCQCIYECNTAVSCNALVGQPLNQISCCLSSTCCAMWVWDTCYHEECHTNNGVTTCDQEAYQCNYHCSYYNTVQQCLGHCGTCMDSTITIYSRQFNQSSTIQTHCNQDDFSCENQQSNFTVNSTWPCYYGGGNTLILQVPAPDKLIGLWWFFVALTSFVWILSCTWLAYEIVGYWDSNRETKVFPFDDCTPSAPLPPAYNPHS